MKEFTAINGAKVQINVADYRSVTLLRSCIEKAIIKANIKINLDSDIFQLLLIVDSDEDVYKHLFHCLKRCTYNGQVINEDTFEDEKAREAYYEIVISCLEVNLKPFMSALILKLTTLGDLAAQSQKSQSQPAS